MKLTQFRGHLILSKEGDRNAQDQAAVPGGVQAADRRAGDGWAHASRAVREFEVSAQSITAWVARAAADAGKPLHCKDVLTSAERDELARLRRSVRQLEQERDILANRPRGESLPWVKKQQAPTLRRRLDSRPLAFWRLTTP